ncbi:transmembrane 220 family protein [Parapedobacter deserti]|uniref:Transmembrane 220 family protein n=1 Tax=Parapedobacter deserti TaxID=1912957 RepID=A0ABV7JSS5_9SPHI
MKAFNIICCIVFVASAALQYNDEDPFLWMPLYLYGAWLCYLAAKGRYLWRAYALGIVIYSAFIVYFLVFKQGALDWFQHHPAKDLVKSMKAEKPWIEETREVLGLLILVAVLAINWIAAKRRNRRLSR